MSKRDFISERILFGGLFGLGYFALVFAVAWTPISQEGYQIIRDAFVLLGPILGMIAQSIWKTDKVERQNADTLNTVANHMATTASGASVSPSPVPEAVLPESKPGAN